jgi:hypothetical protein
MAKARDTAVVLEDILAELRAIRDVMRDYYIAQLAGVGDPNRRTEWLQKWGRE